VIGGELADQLKPGVRAAGHGNRHGMVECRHRVVGHLQQHLVQRHDLRPVGRLGARGLVVHRGDRGLDLVRAGWSPRQRLADQRHALGDLVGVPAAAVLLRHGDQRAVRPGARRPARVGEQHQREEPGHLAVLREQAVHDPGQPDRLGRQLGALQVRAGRAGVPLVENQVEDVQDRREPCRALLGRGHAERDAAVLDGLFGPADPPGHGRLRHQERAGHLHCGQTADRAQGERDLRGRRQRRVAAHEQQDERVVGIGRPAVGGGRQPLVGQHPPGHRLLAALPGLLAAQQVGQPARGDGDEPGAGVLRNTVRPLCRRGDQRLLHGVLGGAEVPVPAHHRAEDLRRQPAQQALDLVTNHGGGYASGSSKPSTIGRTSMYPSRPGPPGFGDLVMRAAISVARSKLSHSTMV
jgi:hypothetical protein